MINVVFYCLQGLFAYLPTNWRNVWVAGFEILVSAFDKDVFIDGANIGMTAERHRDVALFVDNL